MEGPLLAVLITSLLGLDITGASNAVFYRIFRDLSAASPEDQQTSFWRLGLKSRKVFKRASLSSLPPASESGR